MAQTDAIDTSSAPMILLVDDDPDHLALSALWLKRAGYRTETALSGRAALAVLELQRPDLLIADLVMDGMDGLEMVATIQGQDPSLPIIMLSGNARVPDAMQAAQLGVSEFLVKPVQQGDFLAAVSKMLAASGTTHSSNSGHQIPGLVYRSAIMVELAGRIRRVAHGVSTVLITGESGVGKELVARAIHDQGPRCAAPMMSINCSALPEQLLESELFGYEKGAFTGAVVRNSGLFVAADNGTLFLDEIGDMPLSMQAKLLRVLQDLTVRPLGSTRSVSVDVRIIAATNQNLQQMVEAKTFRADLYYRLNVIPLRVPALRERPDDIPVLIDHFLDRFAARSGQARQRFSADAHALLLSAQYPGNVRQLQNVVERCTVLSPTLLIAKGLAAEALEDQVLGLPDLDEAKLGFERRYLASVLRATDGNVSVAARICGRNRSEFYNLLARHALDPQAFRAHSQDDSA